MQAQAPCTCKLRGTSSAFDIATPALASIAIINACAAGGTVDDTANCNP